MTKPVRPYCRVYWEAIDDPKFRDVWDDDGRLAWWLRLLVAADMAWPASANIPRRVKQPVLDSLVAAGLVDLENGDRYRIHGLDAERGGRARMAADAAAARWSSVVPPDDPRHPSGDADRTPSASGRHSGPDPAGDAQAKPSRAKPSRDESSPTPRGGVRMNPRAMGTNPRAVAARERERQRVAAMERQQRYLRGEMSEREYAGMSRVDLDAMRAAVDGDG
jgi:hypothetical protein